MISYVLIAFMLLAVGGIGFYFQKKIVSHYNHIVAVNLPNAVMFGDMNQQIARVHTGIFELSLDVLKPEEMAPIKDKVTIAMEEFEKHKNQYESVKSTVDGEAEVYQPIKDNWPKLKELLNKNLELLTAGNEEKIKEFRKNYNSELGPLIREFSDNLGFVLDLQKAASDENVENASQVTKQSYYAIASSVFVGVILAIVFGIYFSSSLSKEMMSLADSLKEVVGSILEESSKVSTTSSSLLISVEAEAAALQETSSSTEELTAMVKRNEENADGSKTISEESMRTSLAGKEAMDEMMSAINEISDSNREILNSVKDSSDNITEISNSIRQIGEKTKIINDIVFQTKLLSFNASVEAARAGEQGKGFAVVAEEVGNLAQMSGNASKEISEMLEHSIKNVESIIEKSRREVEGLVDKSKNKLERGLEVADNCQKVLEEVVTNATRVNDLLSEISHASKEQTIGIAEISKAISQMDANTSSNTQTAKISELSSKELAANANRLSEIVEKITETVNGQS